MSASEDDVSNLTTFKPWKELIPRLKKGFNEIDIGRELEIAAAQVRAMFTVVDIVDPKLMGNSRGAAICDEPEVPCVPMAIHDFDVDLQQAPEFIDILESDVKPALEVFKAALKAAEVKANAVLRGELDLANPPSPELLVARGLLPEYPAGVRFAHSFAEDRMTAVFAFNMEHHDVPH